MVLKHLAAIYTLRLMTLKVFDIFLIQGWGFIYLINLISLVASIFSDILADTARIFDTRHHYTPLLLYFTASQYNMEMIVKALK